MQTIAIDVKT